MPIHRAESGVVISTPFGIHRTNLTDIDRQNATTTGGIFAWTVPAGKRWRIIGLTGKRANSEDIIIRIGAGTSTQKAILKQADAAVLHLEYYATTDIYIDEARWVEVEFVAGVSGLLEAFFIYEESNVI